MTDLTINTVCSKKQVYPMILNFPNGYPSGNFQFDCALLQDEAGSKTVAVEFNGLLYIGNENNDSDQTLILARNRISGKVRLIQAGTVTLKPLNDYAIEQLEKLLEPDKPNYTLRDENKMKKKKRSQRLTNKVVEPRKLEPNKTDGPQLPENIKKPNQSEESKIIPKRTNYSLSGTSNSELNRLIVSKQFIHMPDITEKDIQTEKIKETDTNTVDISTELSPKYNHIMNYYYDELYKPFDNNNLKRKTEEHEKRKDDFGGFSVIKEMFVKALGLNVNVGDKRNKQNVVHTKNNLENNKMTVSHPAALQKIGNMNKEDDNEVLNDFGDDFNTAPLESKTYICCCCNNKFEDKDSIISHLISQKFIGSAKKARIRPLVKRIEGKIKYNDRSTKRFENIAKKTSKKTKTAKNTGIRLCDEDNATTNHEATKVPFNDLVISDNRQNMKIFHNEFEVTDNFKDSNDDCPIDLATDFDIKQNRVDPERNFICHHCGKEFREKGSLMIHLLTDKSMIVKKSREIINDTKQELKKNEIVKANVSPKCETEEKEQHKIPDIHKERDSNESIILKQARVITRMHLAAHKLINDTIITESKTTTTAKEIIQKHKEIETLNEPKANEYGKNMRNDSEDRDPNDRHNAKQTNRMTSRAQMTNYGNIRNSNKNTNTYNCGLKGNDCGRKLKTKASLNTHRISNSNNSKTIAKNKEIMLRAHTEPFNSKKCSRKLKETGITLKFPITQLERCNLTKHTKKTKFCTLCNYKTPYASRLTRHQRVHTKSYSCQQCKKEFRRNNDFKLHLRTHTGVKPFRCQCGMPFARMDTLNRHLKTHTRAKSYKCSLCTSEFKLLGGLKRHLKIHAEKSYKCTTCASSFSDGSSLKRHIRRHIILKKPYSCERCKYSSANTYDLKRHLKSCKGRLTS